MNEQWQKGLIGAVLVIAAGVIIWLIVIIPRQTNTTVQAGSVDLEVRPEDQSFLNQLNSVSDPQAPNSAFGGSEIKQSPQFDLDTWRQILEGEL